MLFFLSPPFFPPAQWLLFVCLFCALSHTLVVVVFCPLFVTALSPYPLCYAHDRAKQFREGLNHMAPHLDAGLAMIIKQRVKAGAIERMDLVGTVDGECLSFLLSRSVGDPAN